MGSFNGKSPQETLEAMTEALFPEFKEDRSAWVDKPGTPKSAPPRGAFSNRIFKEIGEEDASLYRNLWGKNQLKMIQPLLFSKAQNRAFKDIQTELIEKVGEMAGKHLSELGSINIDKLQNGITQLKLGDTKEAVAELEKQFDKEYSDELKQELKELFDILKSLDLTPTELEANMKEINDRIKSVTKDTLKNIGSAIVGMSKSIGGKNVTQGDYGDVSNVLKLMAEANGTSVVELLQAKQADWKEGNPDKVFASALAEREAFLEDFLGDNFINEVELFFRALDKANNTNFTPEMMKAMRSMKQIRKDALLDLAKTIQEDTKSIFAASAESAAKRRGAYNADVAATQAIMKKYGLKAEDLKDPDIYKTVHEAVIADKDARRESMMTSFRGRYTDLKDQWARQAYGDKIADKIASRREAAEMKGAGLTRGEAATSDALVELQHALRNMEALKAMRPQNDIIYTNELARKRRMAVKRGGPQRRLMERRHQADKQDADDD